MTLSLFWYFHQFKIALSFLNVQHIEMHNKHAVKTQYCPSFVRKTFYCLWISLFLKKSWRLLIIHLNFMLILLFKSHLPARNIKMRKHFSRCGSIPLSILIALKIWYPHIFCIYIADFSLKQVLSGSFCGRKSPWSLGWLLFPCKRNLIINPCHRI